MNKNNLVSIVIPCYNEKGNIDRTIDAIIEHTKDHKYTFEIIAVNDGSKDNTWNIISEYSKKYRNVIGVNLMGNFGQSVAYQAGFDIAKGDYVLTLSADLEIPIKEINEVINKLDEGYDFVNTNRKARWGDEKASRQAKSSMANRILSKISGVSMQDRGSGLKGFRSVLIKNLRLYGEMHRFIPDYLTVYNAKMTEYDVEFKDREYGESYYKGHKRTIKVLLDLVTLTFLLYFAKKPFRTMPGRLFGFTGALITGAGALAGVYLAILKLMGESIGGRPLLILSALMIIVGIQSIMLGMLGELMLRIYFEASNKKTYTIRETTNI